jgi:hypothetical protein
MHAEGTYWKIARHEAHSSQIFSKIERRIKAYTWKQLFTVDIINK